MNRIVLNALAECIDDPVKINELFKIQLKNNRNLRQMLNEAGGEPDDLPDGVALEVENEKLKEELKSYENGEQYYLFFEDEEDYKTHIQELRSEDSKELAKNIDDVARRNNKLELENKKLKEQNEKWKLINHHSPIRFRELKDEVKELKEVGAVIRKILISPQPHRRKQSPPVKKVVKVKKSPHVPKKKVQIELLGTEEAKNRICMCRIWDNKSRRSDVQCTVERSSGEDYCKKHLKNIEKNGSWWLGRIDEDRNEEQYGPPGTKAEQNRHLWHDQKNIKKSKSPPKVNGISQKYGPNQVGDGPPSWPPVKKSPQPKKSPPVKEQVWGECYCCESEYYENEMDLIGTGDGPKYFCLTCSHLTDE